MSQDDPQFIIEFTQVGQQVKATAFDPVSLREASIFGPASATRAQLSQLAVRKLYYLLEKNKSLKH